jgi:hypothetical protein
METLNFDTASSLLPGIPYCYDNMNKDFVVDPAPKLSQNKPGLPIHFEVIGSFGPSCREAVSVLEKALLSLDAVILSLTRDGRVFASINFHCYHGFQFLVVLPAQEMVLSEKDGKEVYLWNRTPEPITFSPENMLFAEFSNRDSFAGSLDVESFEKEVYNIVSELLTGLIYRHLVLVGFREETAREPKVRWYRG